MRLVTSNPGAAKLDELRLPWRRYTHTDQPRTEQQRREAAIEDLTDALGDQTHILIDLTQDLIRPDLTRADLQDALETLATLSERAAEYEGIIGHYAEWHAAVDNYTDHLAQLARAATR